jgi:hypothetical protein
LPPEAGIADSIDECLRHGSHNEINEHGNALYKIGGTNLMNCQNLSKPVEPQSRSTARSGSIING